MFLPRAATIGPRFLSNPVSLATISLILVLQMGCGRTEVTAQSPPATQPLSYLAEWGTHGHEPGELGRPEWLATDFAGNAYIADSGTGSIEKFDPEGHPLLSFDDRVPDEPFRVAVDAGAGIYVLSPNANAIFVFSAEGEPSRHYLLSPIKAHQRPESIAVDDAGDIYAIVRIGETPGRPESREIREYNSRGRYIKTLVPALVSSVPFVPESVATGADGKLYVLDVSGSRVQKFTLDGDYITAWGDAPAAAPPGEPLPAGGGIGITSKYVITPDSTTRGVKFWTLDGQPKFVDSLDGRLQNGTGRYQIAASARGELLVLDVAGTRVLRFRINL